ncbi:hypothetical protein [Sulfuricurvum sp.]|nr:hypothetical protein [Sulfuricurvum sp.]
MKICLEEASFSAQAASVVLWALLKARLKESSQIAILVALLMGK